ncbi:hypothetical protein [Kyrpidia spormannii]|uniref:Uncharacterized protein n=1 Tax=Kyrpidia spormannii TaxID=2055160 RepID=A0A6F9EG14_9BACL|nr:hypothetical protein [Kyrpidia spormannii]CAB3395438.1 conserved protein of unknown function [Kyrpidia spormannii]
MTCVTKRFFQYDSRLEVEVPYLDRDWDEYPSDLQEAVIIHWVRIRAGIPDVIARFEKVIATLQERAAVEDDWDQVCKLYWEIADYASRINDLNILYRSDPELTSPGNSSTQTEAKTR